MWPWVSMTATGWSRCSVRMSSSLDPTSAPGSTIRQCSPSPDATTQPFVPQIADGIPAMNTAELPRVVTTGQLTLEPAPIWAPQRSVLVGWQPTGVAAMWDAQPIGGPALRRSPYTDPGWQGRQDRKGLLSCRPTSNVERPRDAIWNASCNVDKSRKRPRNDGC